MTGEPHAVGHDRRTAAERRAQRHRLWGPWLLRGHRYVGRRREDRYNRYVDRYSLQTALIVMAAMVLCAVDACCTMILIERGAYEANPFMEAMLSMGDATFTHTKLALTAIGLLILAAHKNFLIFNTLHTEHVMKACLVGYALLIYYEGILLTM